MYAIRRELIEFGSLPIASWLHHLDSAAALQNLLRQLLDSGHVQQEGQQSIINITDLAHCLDIPLQHAAVLLDTIESVALEHVPVVKRGPDQEEPAAVDVHALLLFLFAQLHVRQQARPDAMDVWPSQAQQEEKASSAQLIQPHQQAQTQMQAPPHAHMHNGFVGPGSPRLQPGSPHVGSPHLGSPLAAGPLQQHLQLQGAEQPSSPARSQSSRSSSGSQGTPQGPHIQPGRSNHLARKELQYHLYQHQQLLHGYTDFVARHTHQLLSLVLRKPPAPGSSLHHVWVTAAEFEQLGLLLRSSGTEEPSASQQGGSPMDIGPASPFLENDSIGAHVPLFPSQDPTASAQLPALGEWLAANIVDEAQGVEAMASSPTHSSKWGPLAPAGVVQGNVVDIQAVCKSTVARGEDDFPSGIVRITDCHDTVIYVLAPLQYASIACCTDCTVVVGAVARMLRLDRCERLQVHAASRRITINSCHECTLYLGVNHPPLLLGDNRFLQFAPYCTQYERLPAHLETARISTEVNLWNQPVTLAREQKLVAPDGHFPNQRELSARQPFSLLPPEQLLPFMVPFRGAAGSLCGGAASPSGPRISADLGSLVGLAGELNSVSSGSAASSLSSAGSLNQSSLPPCPFALPSIYEEAKGAKVDSVAELRMAVKSAVLDDGRKKELQSVIQAHFKDWLVSSGNMRQVYDLARMERGDATPSAHSQPPF